MFCEFCRFTFKFWVLRAELFSFHFRNLPQEGSPPSLTLIQKPAAGGIPTFPHAYTETCRRRDPHLPLRILAGSVIGWTGKMEYFHQFYSKGSLIMRWNLCVAGYIIISYHIISYHIIIRYIQLKLQYLCMQLSCYVLLYGTKGFFARIFTHFWFFKV